MATVHFAAMTGALLASWWVMPDNFVETDSAENPRISQDLSPMLTPCRSCFCSGNHENSPFTVIVFKPQNTRG
jgi:hypothetical protein